MSMSALDPAPQADDEQSPAGRPLPDIASARHINHTPFPSQYYQTVDQHGEAFHVVATRITYDMRQLWGDGYLGYAEHQTELATSDVWDGAVNESSPLWESDYAPYKPRCDVLVAHAVSRPDKSLWEHISGASAGSARRWPCSIALRWQDEEGHRRTWHKQLIATGPRTHGLLGAVSQPEPAQQTTIHWQNAFGGQLKEPATDQFDRRGQLTQAAGSKRWQTDERNPVGCGLDKSRGKPAPRLEVAGGAPYSGQSDYPPISLTAVGKAWLPRRLRAGTHDQRWRDEQWPLPPLDFDYAYWNCAPPDQQIDYPTPGAQLDLLGLYPPHASQGWPEHFSAKLPPHQLFVHAYVPSTRGVGPDLLAKLDTLVIDMQALQVYAIHRVVLNAVDLPLESAPLVLETRLAPSARMNESVSANELGPLG